MFAKHLGDEIMFLAYSRGKLNMPFLITGLVLHELPFKLIEFEKEINYDVLCVTLLIYISVIGIDKIRFAYMNPMEYFEFDKLL
jgi:hypothetical protein